jgi:serine/threonine-protein kinase
VVRWPPDAVPTVFGKYTLTRKLAEGGMAELFLARQGGMEGFEKLVVVKRILPQLSKDPAFINMFLNEARVAARLNHTNIAQIFDLGKADDLYYIAMEYVHGEDLRELIRVADESRFRPPLGLVCRMIADTLAGLHYAHTRATPDGKPLGLVHRDVSPQNVIITYEGGVKLVDFGIAKATQATNEQTQAGLFKGKFAYMSPEQSTGRPLDARSDVFAVGILLWELCTWHRLFKRPTDMATLIAVAEDPIPPASQLDPSVPPELDHIIARALARPLQARYQTAQDMRADLEALIRNQRWEGDALAMAGFMRQLFSAKLRQQDADIRAAGLASLDDFLMRVEESTRITWMETKRSPNERRTPSIGLPSAPPTAPGVQPSGPLNDAPTEALPVASNSPAAAAAAANAARKPPKPKTSSSSSIPKPPDLFAMRAPAVSAKEAPTLKPTGVPAPSTPPPPPLDAESTGMRSSNQVGHNPPSGQTKMPPTYGGTPADRLAAASAYADAPTVTTATTADPDDETFMMPAGSPLATPPTPAPPPKPSMPARTAPPDVPTGEARAPLQSHHEMPTLPPVGVFAPVSPPMGNDDSTAKRDSFDPEPTDRRRRILVIAIAAAVVLAIGLTILLWPGSPPPPVT